MANIIEMEIIINDQVLLNAVDMYTAKYPNV